MLTLCIPFITGAQTSMVDSPSVNISGVTGLNLHINAADSDLSVHFGKQGLYFNAESLYKNQVNASIDDFQYQLKTYYDRSKDSLLTARLLKRSHPAKRSAVDPYLVWAFSDGKVIYLNAENRYLPGTFYPLLVKEGHYYYKAYDGPDPASSSVLGGIMMGVGGGFSFGPLAIGVSSALPLAEKVFSGKRKLPSRHLVWMEYMFRTGTSVELHSSPFALRAATLERSRK